MTYMSFCWALGTTSFRMKEFNRKIEQQLKLLNEFWSHKENAEQKWLKNQDIQEKYYNFLKEHEFISGDASNKAKDAREKTSGLVDIGLIDYERRLTEAGIALLDVVNKQAFGRDNQLFIPNDSYIYLKQLLKTSYKFSNNYVRPYVVTAYVISVVGAIDEEEFTYLIPLITDSNKLSLIIDGIKDKRDGKKTIDEIIINVLLDMPNYKEALKLWQNNSVTEDLVVKIGMNRKSRDYDKPYFNLYQILNQYVLKEDEALIEPLINSILSLNEKPADFWKQLIFNANSIKKIKKDKKLAINKGVKLLSLKNEKEFKEEFFKMLHLIKAKATLSDYFDLNRRYFKITDTFVFKDNTVDLDIIPKCYFSILGDKLLSVAFTKSNNLFDDSDITEILPGSFITNETIFEKMQQIYGIDNQNIFEAKKYIEDSRLARFNEMIDRKFPKETLINLLKSFEERNDDFIQDLVTNNADIPTIFEYIIGIIWYNISERKVNILESFNLSLDADLLPKSHATGGSEDLTFNYECAEDYPQHSLLLEVTLTDNANQRRMEMEPVSRHLGSYLLRNKGKNAYSIFIATYLHINVISDFRGRRNQPYYSNDGSECINEMKIIPLATKELSLIISKNITYSKLYSLFEKAYSSADAPNIWYEKNICQNIV